ncbi:MAG: NADP-dependent isocitrate dehydrogenase [Bacteroidota bacterium]
MSEQRVPITVAHGDGIGPEIMDAVLAVLDAAGARIDIETVQIGEEVYKTGDRTGFPQEAWDSLERTRVMLKAPITTPQGGGYKSLNVTMRKTLGLFANVRPSRSYMPYVESKHPVMDIVIVRENEEDTYAGIEHRQTDEVYQCLKLISRPGTERIVRYAFEYAKKFGRKKITCMTKDNIMKFTDGLFHEVFEEIAKEYPEIEAEHWIIDIGAAKLADSPENFDVIVTPNLYGDVISDIAAQIAGSVGMAGGANIGMNYAMFEAIHGSAPRRAGQNLANPSALLNGAIQMLLHIKQPDIAEKVHNAWLKTLEDGVHTYDVYDEKISTKKVGTKEFGEAIVERLGQKPEKLKAVSYANVNTDDEKDPKELYGWKRPTPAKKTLVGVDIFTHWNGWSPDEMAEILKKDISDKFELTMITNRGTKVWPEGNPETFCTDHWRCRFMLKNGGGNADVAEQLAKYAAAGVDFIKTEHLYEFDGERQYSKGQGE